LEAVVPFDILLDRRKRTKFLSSLKSTLETNMKAKVLHDAGIALASLVVCEEALERELIISNSYVLFLSLSFSPVLAEYNLKMLLNFLVYLCMSHSVT
jgi:hypothetical protein